MTQEPRNLMDVKIGDVFMRYDGGWSPILHKVECERITSKQAIIGGVKYWKKDARQVGRDTWSRMGNLMLFEQEYYDAAKEGERLDTRRHRLGDVKWKSLPADVVNKVWDLVQGQTSKG